MHYDIARYVIGIASNLAKIYEAVAGSSREVQQIEMIKEYLEEHVDNLVLEPVEVTTWDEHYCMIYVDGKRHRCSVHPPYEGYVDLEVTRDKILLINSLNDVKKLRSMGSATDRVIVVEGIGDPNCVATYSYAIKDLKPLAIVFVDNFDALRRIVVVEDLIPRYSPTRPLSMPVLHVAKTVGEELRRAGNVRILIRTGARPSYGYNVIAELHGSGTSSLYLTAHHDRWFCGAVDNVIGVSILIWLASSPILRKLLRSDVTLAFFTAEEGFPNPLTSFYWLVGSRAHVVNEADKILDRVGLVINIDVVYGRNLQFSSSNLISRGYLIKLGVDDESIEHDNMMYDSYAFTLLGIPSITIHSYKEVLDAGIYHSTLDVVERLSVSDLAVGAISTILTLVKGFETMRETDWRELLSIGAKTLVKELALRINLPLEVKLYIHKLLKGLIFGSTSEAQRLLPALHRSITSTCISRRILEGENVYETTSYMLCEKDCIPIPSITSMFTDQYRNLLHNLESLAYILQGVVNY